MVGWREIQRYVQTQEMILMNLHGWINKGFPSV